MLPTKKIALVAHDNEKQDLLEGAAFISQGEISPARGTPASGSPSSASISTCTGSRPRA
jgi:hypothetical protein